MIREHNTALVVAAGNGHRMASGVPKQFLTLRNKEILSYSVETFFTHPKIHEVIIVTSSDYMEHVVEHYPNCKIVVGGKTRQDSVFNGLQACSADTSIILVHDAARPLIPSQIIDDCLLSLQSNDGVAPTIEPVDSMVELEANGFRSLRRDRLRVIQTPQCFHFNVLMEAHNSGKIDTDEIGLVRRSNPQARLQFVAGAPETIKLTRPMDLKTLEIFLQQMEE